MNVHAIYRVLFAHFRPARMRRFEKLCGISASTRILDMGGDRFNWQFLNCSPNITILNLRVESTGSVDGFAYIQGDGCATPFPDAAFDVVFSNSVIEHVGDHTRQRAFADECRRCGRGYFVQTPNRWFPIDLHTWLPFAHWLPDKWFKRLIPFAPRVLLEDSETLDLADSMELRLLGEREMKELFPEAIILKERFLGIAKSLIAVRV